MAEQEELHLDKTELEKAVDKTMEILRDLVGNCEENLKRIHTLAESVGGKTVLLAALGDRGEMVEEIYDRIYELVEESSDLTPEAL